MEKFNLLASDIIDLELKLDGKLPINRDELLALTNSWGRDNFFCTKNKNNNDILIIKYETNENYDLSKLNVSEIKNFDSIFAFSNFEDDISKWDVSNATSMADMFYKAKKFNSPLDNWNVSNVTDMKAMFTKTKRFNQNINSWDVSKVTSMAFIFTYTQKFNSPLDKWDVSNVTNMYDMFSYTKQFNQNINSWNISNVLYMISMFEGAEAFNQPILWDLSHIKYCAGMFLNTKAFKDKFNNGLELNVDIKEWIKDNRGRMIALDIEDNKKNDLDNFLLNFKNKGIYNGHI